MKRFIFRADTLDDYSNWAIIDIKVFIRINELLKEIKRTPFSGIGKPEPLKHQYKGYWSRRITQEHRLIYKVSGDDILIVNCKGHYD